MLRRLHTDMMDDNSAPLLRRTSKRQRILAFFRAWKHKQSPPRRHARPCSAPRSLQPANTTTALVAISHAESPTKYHHIDSQQTSPDPALASTAQDQQTLPFVHGRMLPANEPLSPGVPTPPPDAREPQVETLTDGQLHALFGGAPHFAIAHVNGRCTPTASFPWSPEAAAKHVTDTAPLAEPAYSAATLHKHTSKADRPSETGKQYNGYTVDVVESPSMLDSHGIEPGTVGFAHFLELPQSDVFLSTSQPPQSSTYSFDASNNKNTLQTSPERLGIRALNLGLIYDRLSEFQDMYEAFHDSPEPMTILNTQTSSELYANLFTKFLTPPGYDGAIDDPTGMHSQITALLRVLSLKGIWYNFSLVEWRIRLGQILWSKSESVSEDRPQQPLWSERDILLLQITLACELLLRLDAFTNADAADAAVRLQINPRDVEVIVQNKSQKIDWDLILARTFLDNIAIIRGCDTRAHPKPKSRSLLSLFVQTAYHELPESDITFFPQHQARQVAGLVHFAKTIQWPGLDVVSAELFRKLAPQEKIEHGTPSSSTGKLMDSPVPSCLSVYGTPLQSSLAPGQQLDGYFGHIGQSVLDRSNSHTFNMALSPNSPVPQDQSKSVTNNVGGWISRSYLTGLVLPGEAMSHFLMSTLLENDERAIASLGASANLYGGFIFGGRTFWSKNSIVGRILACVKDATECMGWVSCPKLPESPSERWYSIHSETVHIENRTGKGADSDLVSHDSAIVPRDCTASVKSENFVLPRDLSPAPPSSFLFTQWELMPMNADLIDGDSSVGSSTENDIHSPSMTFVSSNGAISHTLTLAYDVQFVASWPCVSAVSVPSSASRPKVLRRSVTGPLTRTSSKHSDTRYRRNSHGFEPLLSHPPNAIDNTPRRMYDAPPMEEGAVGGGVVVGIEPLNAHLLHKSYSYQIVPMTEVLDPDFLPFFELHTSRSSQRLPSLSESSCSQAETKGDMKKAVLVIDSRASWHLQLAARAWCAEKGFHALVSRSTRTCLACSIREARGLGIHIVIRI